LKLLIHNEIVTSLLQKYETAATKVFKNFVVFSNMPINHLDLGVLEVILFWVHHFCHLLYTRIYGWTMAAWGLWMSSSTMVEEMGL